MKIAEFDDVQLIAIKTKSLQDLDNETNVNFNTNKFTKNNYCRQSLSAEANSQKYEFLVESDDEEEESDDDHYESSVRFLTIEKSANGACGFHLTRTKWDPYPWVSAVDNFTPAAKCDLKAGDCVLKVNGCDVLGLRITEIAKLVKSSQHQITLLLWSSNCNTKCDKDNLCAAPMPRSLQRLSLVVQTILSLIECPVCLDTITPPAMQCQNGHLLCVNCRIRAEKCPVCRDRFFPRPALIAEQIQSAITTAFNLCRNEDKVRQKVFGRHNRQRKMVKTTLLCLQLNQQHEHKQEHKSSRRDTLTKGEEATRSFTPITSKTTAIINGKCDRIVTDKFLKRAASISNNNQTKCNKFLTKFLNSKACSMENLTNGQSKAITTTNNGLSSGNTTIKPAISQSELLDMKQKQQQQQSLNLQAGELRTLFKDFVPGQQQQQTFEETSTNQFNDSPRNVAKNANYLTVAYKPHLNDLKINSKLCCKQMLSNKMKHFSLSSDKYLTITKGSTNCALDASGIFMNGRNITPSSQVICEASHATISKAINVKEIVFGQKNLWQNNAQVSNKFL